MGGFGLAGNTNKTGFKGSDGSTQAVDNENRLPVKEDPKTITEIGCLLEEILIELKKQNVYLAEILGD